MTAWREKKEKKSKRSGKTHHRRTAFAAFFGFQKERGIKKCFNSGHKATQIIMKPKYMIRIHTCTQCNSTKTIKNTDEIWTISWKVYNQNFICLLRGRILAWVIVNQNIDDLGNNFIDLFTVEFPKIISDTAVSRHPIYCHSVGYFHLLIDTNLSVRKWHKGPAMMLDESITNHILRRETGWYIQMIVSAVRISVQADLRWCYFEGRYTYVCLEIRPFLLRGNRYEFRPIQTIKGHTCVYVCLRQCMC